MIKVVEKVVEKLKAGVEKLVELENLKQSKGMEEVDKALSASRGTKETTAGGTALYHRARKKKMGGNGRKRREGERRSREDEGFMDVGVGSPRTPKGQEVQAE